MTECANIEMRELLPDLLHEELSSGRRSQVEAHLATCAACAGEMALLRDAQRVLQATPIRRIDTMRIVAALPRPGAADRPLARTVAPRSRVAWRIAAAVSMISLGGLSFAVARGRIGAGNVADTVAAVTTAVPTTPAGSPAETTVAIADPATIPGATISTSQKDGLSAAGGISDLKDSELQALLGDLDRLEAAPVAEPDALNGSRLVNGVTAGTGTED